MKTGPRALAQYRHARRPHAQLYCLPPRTGVTSRPKFYADDVNRGISEASMAPHPTMDRSTAVS